MKLRTLVLCAFAVTGLLGLAACGSDSSGEPDGSCSEDTDCNGGILERCVNGLCQTKVCVTASDCMGGEYCKLASGQSRGVCAVLPACTDDAICPYTFHCVSSACVSAACNETSDCRTDETCNTTAKLCEETAPICTTGETRCRDAVLETCAQGGAGTIGWRFTDECENGCAITAGVAACVMLVDGDEENETEAVERICASQSTRCSDTGAIETCAVDGSAWSVTDPCTQGTCDDSVSPAVCGPKVVCTPRVRECSSDNASVRICKDDGTGYTIQQCVGGQTCKIQPTGAQCVSSSLCTGNRYRCENNVTQQCKSDGSAWITIENCGTDSTCTCTQEYGGQCTQAVCKSDPICTALTEKRCDGDKAQRCSFDGMSWSTWDNCADNDPVQVCQNGECVTP